MDAVTHSIQSSDSNNYIRRLEDNEKITIVVPKSIIMDSDIDELRTAIFLLLYVRRGQDNILYISINTIVKWLRQKPNKHKGRINYKVLDCLYYLKEKGYIKFDDRMIKSLQDSKNESAWDLFFAVNFNYDKVQEDISFVNDERQPFAQLYWDEVLKIIKFENKSKNGAYAYKDNPTILLIFCYLRLKIGYKKNDWIAANDLYYNKIASDIGVSDRKVSECIKILSELNFIYYENLKAVKMEDGQYRKNTTIFASTYHRGYYDNIPVLLEKGEKYYLNEVRQYKHNKLKMKE